MSTVARVHRPRDVRDLCEIVADAAAHGGKLGIAGGASKAAIGRPGEASILDMTAFRGVVDYDPPELVLTVRPGTSLAEIQALVANEGQMLAFDPFDHGPMFGTQCGAATMGGVVAAGVAGPGRLSHGGARDHLLGFSAVSGRGEAFVAGAKVVKNVTGYDVPKLMAGSWGRLAALTELTLKVLPRPKRRLTLLLADVKPVQASNLLSRVMGAPLDVTAAAYLPGSEAMGDTPTMAVRLQGFQASVEARGAVLHSMLEEHGAIERIDDDACERFWADITHVTALADEPTLWRISTPPSRGLSVVDALALEGARWQWDWAGGLTWLGFDGDPCAVRRAARDAGGHAMLVRAPADVRRQVPAHHPPASGLARLEEQVRRAFDPAGIFETGRF